MNVAFLDRDGTLIYEPYDGIVRPEDFRVLPGVIEGLLALKTKGYVLVMVTNQDFTRGDRRHFETTQEMLLAELQAKGIVFDHIFLCPHSPEDHCTCRKPKTGMVDAFLEEHPIDRAASFVAGDRAMNDGGLARNIGVRYIPVSPNGGFPDIGMMDVSNEK